MLSDMCQVKSAAFLKTSSLSVILACSQRWTERQTAPLMMPGRQAAPIALSSRLSKGQWNSHHEGHAP